MKKILSEPKRELEGKCQVCKKQTLDKSGETIKTAWVLTKIETGYSPDEINGEWCNRCFKAILKAK